MRAIVGAASGLPRLVGGQVFAFLSRARHKQGVTAVGLHPEGFGLVHMVFEPGARPRLELSEFVSCDEPRALRRELEALVKEHGLVRSRCVCVPWVDRYTLRQIDAPNVEPEELRDAARWSVKDLVDFDIENAIIDVFDIPEPENSTASCASRIYVVAAPKSAVEETARTIESAGLRVKAMDIVELALRNVAALLPHDEHGVGLLFLAPGLGLLTVTRRKLLYLARTIDIDVDQIDVKLAAAEAAEDDDLMSLRREVQRSVDYYERQFAQDPMSVLFVAPLANPTPALTQYLAEHLSVEVRPLDLNQLVRCEEGIDEALQARCLTAVGGALREGMA